MMSIAISCRSLAYNCSKDYVVLLHYVISIRLLLKAPLAVFDDFLTELLRIDLVQDSCLGFTAGGFTQWT